MTAPSDVLSALGALDQKRTVLFVCDIQEKFRGVMLNFDAIVSNTKKLVSLLIDLDACIYL